MAEINAESVAYIFGVLSIVLAFFSPLAGIIIGIIGLIQSNKNKVPKAKKLNIIGIILGVIFLAVSLFLLAYSGSTAGGFPIF